MWNRLSSSHKNHKKANSRWWSVWNEPLDWAGTKGIMQPFRLFLAGAPFVPRTEMLPHWGPWKLRFRSICLKAADLCDNLKTRDVNVSLTHRLLNGYFVMPCDRPVIPHMVIPERKGWRKRAEGFREGTLVGAPHRWPGRSEEAHVTLILEKAWELEQERRFDLLPGWCWQMYPFLHELCFIQWLWSLEWLLKQAKCDTWLLSFYSSQGYMVKSQTRLSHVSLDCIHALVGTVKLYNGRCLPCSLLLTPVCFFLYFQSNNCQQCQKYRSIILSQDVELILVFYKSAMERSLCTQAFWHRYSRHTHTDTQTG